MSSDFRAKKIFGKYMRVSDIPLDTKTGRTLVFFLGAGFCPFCAAERWAIVEALKNFGAWHNLLEDFSAEKDEKYLNIPTFNFLKARYSSEHIEFQAVETADRYFKPIDSDGNDRYGVLENYNPDHIIPFTLVDGQFMQVGCGYSPKLFEALDHKKVREQLLDRISTLGSAIKNEADYLSTMICYALKNKAEGVCTESRIKNLLKQI